MSTTPCPRRNKVTRAERRLRLGYRRGLWLSRRRCLWLGPLTRLLKAGDGVCSGCSMTFLARVSGESGRDETGDDHKDEGDGDEREALRPRRGPARPGTAMSRSRRSAGHRGVGAAEDVRVRRGHREDGEQQWRVSTAARATASRAPLTMPPIAAGSTTVMVTRASSRRGRSSPSRSGRHEPQHLIGGKRITIGGTRQASARREARAQRSTQIEKRNSPMTMDGRPVIDVGQEAYEPRQHALAAVLVEESRQDAERHGHERRDSGDLDRAEHRRPDAAVLAGATCGGMGLVEELPADDQMPLAITV